MSVLVAVQEAVNAIRGRCDVRPTVGLVLGSGFAPLARIIERPSLRLPYQEIPHWPTGSVAGHGHELVIGSVGSATTAAVLAGRAHAYEGFTGPQLALPIRVLARLGVRTIVLTSAVGSLNPGAKPADLVIVEDHLNLMGLNPLVGPHEDGLGPRFPDLTQTYDPSLRQMVEKLCWKLGVTALKGVYAGFLGPSYETPAEIRMARSLGADVVGMSMVPEAIAARQCGMRVLGLACVTNLAAGISRQPLSHKDVLAAAQHSRAALADLAEALLPMLDGPGA